MKKINYEVHNHDVKYPHRTCRSYFDENELDILEKDGYIKLDYIFDKENLQRLKLATEKLLIDKYDKDNNINTYTSKKFAGQYIRQPHLRSKSFLDILNDDYPFIDIARSIMGPRIVIRSYSIRVTYPQSGAGTMWHSDQRSKISPKPRFFTDPKVFTLSIYLDGTNDDIGPLYVLPGSHSWDKQPKEQNWFENLEGQKKINLKAGESVLFNSAIWHKGGYNNSKKIRRCIILHLAPIFCKVANYENIKPSNQYIEFLKGLYETKDEAMLELLGYNGLKEYPGFM